MTGRGNLRVTDCQAVGTGGQGWARVGGGGPLGGCKVKRWGRSKEWAYQRA